MASCSLYSHVVVWGLISRLHHYLMYDEPRLHHFPTIWCAQCLQYHLWQVKTIITKEILEHRTFKLLLINCSMYTMIFTCWFLFEWYISWTILVREEGYFNFSATKHCLTRKLSFMIEYRLWSIVTDTQTEVDFRIY